MSKKRAKVEFRYYEMPEKDLVLALLGEKWIRTYGKDIDYLHFHNYLEIGLCHYGEGIVVLDEKEYRFQDNSIVIIPPRLPHTTNASVDTKAYWEWMYFDIDTLLEEIYPQDKLNLQELKNKIYEKAYYFLMEETAYQTGFDNMTTFNRNFKRFLGMTPYQWQKSSENYEGKLLNYRISAQRWAIGDSQGPRNDGMYYHEAVMKSYAALRQQGLNVDVISEAQSLKEYRLIVAPMLYLFREGIEEKIRQFVEAGGTFVMTYWSGIVDENDRCFLGGTPHNLMDVFGIRRTETDSLFDTEKNRLMPADSKGEVFECSHLCDLLKEDTAEPLYTYGKDFYKGIPAVTVNRWKNGRAYYVGADAEQSFYNTFYKSLVAECAMPCIVSGDIPEGMEVSSRHGNGTEYIFIQNFNNKEVDIKGIALEGEILYKKNTGHLLEPYGTMIIKK